MILARMALRNLARNPRRTVLSLGAIVVGVGALVVGRGFLAGLSENIVRSQIDVVSGHVVLVPARYPDQQLAHPVDGLYAVDDALAAELDAVGSAWTERLLFVATATFGPDGLRVRGIGFDPGRDAAVLPRDAWKVAGRVPASADDGVLVSQGVARLLEVGEGGTLTLQTRTPAGAINALRLPVSGVVSAANPWLDTFGVLLPLDLARSLVDAPGLSSHVAVRLPTRREAAAAAAAARLTAVAPPGVEVHTWMDETAELMEVQRIRQRALDLLVIVLLGMSATGIANTVLMAAYERVREVGTLRAMGMTRTTVTRLFLLEGVFLGVVGATLGTALAAGVVAWFGRYGIDLSGPFEQGAGGHIPVSTVLYLAFDPPWVVGGWVFGVVTATLASVLPARVAASMPIAEAVRA